MKNDYLNNMQCGDTFKAYSISLTRLVYKNPEVLLYLYKEFISDPIGERLKELYETLKGCDNLDEAIENLNEMAVEFNWENVEDTFCEWGKYGWVLYPIKCDINLWDAKPRTQKEADSFVLSIVKKEMLDGIFENLRRKSKNKSVLEEAINCFINRYYTACASLLFSLIDGELISNKSKLQLINKKTGIKAGERVTNEVKKDGMFNSPGFLHLQIINFESFINEYFKNAEGFKNEPKNINRNYLHHGMSKRKVLRKDCIKLFLAYEQTIDFSNHKIEV